VPDRDAATGYLGSSFTRYPIQYFGHTLPHWGFESPVLKDLCSQIHHGTAIAFMTLIAVHVAAALTHLFARDSVFDRMGSQRRGPAHAAAPGRPLPARSIVDAPKAPIR
jgi:cytochrome b561